MDRWVFVLVYPKLTKLHICSISGGKRAIFRHTGFHMWIENTLPRTFKGWHLKLLHLDEPSGFSISNSTVPSITLTTTTTKTAVSSTFWFHSSFNSKPTNFPISQFPKNKLEVCNNFVNLNGYFRARAWFHETWNGYTHEDEAGYEGATPSVRSVNSYALRNHMKHCLWSTAESRFVHTKSLMITIKPTNFITILEKGSYRKLNDLSAMSNVSMSSNICVDYSKLFLWRL